MHGGVPVRALHPSPSHGSLPASAQVLPHSKTQGLSTKRSMRCSGGCAQALLVSALMELMCS